MLRFVVLLAVVNGCGGDDAAVGPEAGVPTDSPVDSAVDAGPDALADAPTDAQPDAQPDAATGPFTLSVTRSGGGQVNGGNVNCGGQCETTFSSATGVTLTAVPDGDAVFLGWTGDCTGTGPCTLQVDSPKRVAASFGACHGAETAVVRFGGTRDDRFDAIAADGAGNIVVAGAFEGTLGNLTGAGGHDAVIAKIDASGSVVWQVGAGNTGEDFARGIAIAPNGDVIVVGGFERTISIGGTQLASAGLSDGFVARLSSGSGSVIWARSFGGFAPDSVAGVAVDPGSGAIAIVGELGGTVAFGSAALTSVGMQDGFVALLDASGTPLWARRGGGTGYDKLNAVAIGASGDVLATGTFESREADVGGTPWVGSSDVTQMTPPGDVIVAAWSSMGTLRWTRELGNIDADVGTAIASDASGTVFVTGAYGFTPRFQAREVTRNRTDTFIASFTSGGTERYARRLSSDTQLQWYQVATSIAVDSGGHVFIGGWAEGDLDLGAGRLHNAREGTRDAYVVEVDAASGAFQWGRRIGGTGNDAIRGIAIAAGTVHVAGSFERHLDACVTTIDSAGGSDALLLRLAPPGTAAPFGEQLQPAPPITPPPPPPLTCVAPPAPPGLPTIVSGPPMFLEQPWGAAFSFQQGSPNGLALADLDGDLDVDIYVAFTTALTGDDHAHVFRNTGGSFSEVTASVMPGLDTLDGPPNQIVAVFDANGDQRADIYQPNAGLDRYPWPGAQDQLFLGTASGFVEGTDGLPLVPTLTNVALPGDFDCDGDLDVYGPGPVPDGNVASVLIGDGTGRFVAERRVSLPTEPIGLFEGATCDVDRDGDLDVVVGDSGPSPDKNFLLRNDGHGVFTTDGAVLPPKVMPHEGSGRIYCVDVDLDGWSDIITFVSVPSTGSTTLRLWHNRGDGTFADDTSTRLPAPAFSEAGADVAYADFNGDGWPDFVTSAHGCNGRSVPVEAQLFINQGGGVFAEIPGFLPTTSGCSRIFALDADGDARPDLFRAIVGATSSTLLMNITP